MPQLLGLLHDSAVAGAAATALMMLTLAKEGKVAVHQVRPKTSLWALPADHRISCTACALECALWLWMLAAPRCWLHLRSAIKVPCMLANCIERANPPSHGNFCFLYPSQAKGLSACLAVLQMQLQQGHELQETLCSQVLQAITNSAEYGPCNVELQRSPQLQMIKEMAGMEGRSLLAAAATQALRMAGVKKGEAQST